MMWICIRRLALDKASYVGPFLTEQSAHDFARALDSTAPFVVVKLHVPSSFSGQSENKQAGGNDAR